MKFVQNFTPPDFQVKNFTPPISPNFNSFSEKKTQKMSENGEIYTAGNKFYTAAGTDGMDKFHLWEYTKHWFQKRVPKESNIL